MKEWKDRVAGLVAIAGIVMGEEGGGWRGRVKLLSLLLSFIAFFYFEKPMTTSIERIYWLPWTQKKRRGK